MRPAPMHRRRSIVLAAALAFSAVGTAAPAAASAAHPALSLTIAVQKVEVGAPAKAVVCWRNVPAGWVVHVASANSSAAPPTTVFSTPATPASLCVKVPLPTEVRGAHPITASLLTAARNTFATAFSALYVYAPVVGSTFLKSILAPACHGHGTAVIGGASLAWTCSMAAVTSHLTVKPTSCRSARFRLASTDDPAGGGANKGSSVYELAQNLYKPAFKRFEDDVAVSLSVPLAGSAFWVAFKSTSPSSRLYFLNGGTTADCYTANGVA